MRVLKLRRHEWWSFLECCLYLSGSLAGGNWVKWIHDGISGRIERANVGSAKFGNWLYLNSDMNALHLGSWTIPNDNCSWLAPRLGSKKDWAHALTSVARGMWVDSHCKFLNMGLRLTVTWSWHRLRVSTSTIRLPGPCCEAASLLNVIQKYTWIIGC